MTSRPTILLVDDEEGFLEMFAPLFGMQGFEAIACDSAKAALTYLEREPVDVIVSDIQMPGMSGTELFARVQDLYPEIPVILMTAFGSTEQAVQAVKQGAFHYFEKPIANKLDLFWATVREALVKREMSREIDVYRREKSIVLKKPLAIIGQSEGIARVLKAVEDVANLPVTVLILGETGTGKELVARAIHEMSDRRCKPFFAVNSTEFAMGVLESELFGHEKGAFTGALGRRKGLFELADGGTLFWDEISEASHSLQCKLLRVLETKTFMRVGGTAPVYSDFRIVAATNRSLVADVASERFRKDLYYRLNVYVIDIPPLRERREDIPLLAEFYLKKFSEMFHRSVGSISGDALAVLKNYDWPGNVREMVNVLERAVITCRNSMITTRHLPFDLEGRDHAPMADLNLRAMERHFVQLAMERTGNNKSKAAELLGISRKNLLERLKNYGLYPTVQM